MKVVICRQLPALSLVSLRLCQALQGFPWLQACWQWCADHDLSFPHSPKTYQSQSSCSSMLLLGTSVLQITIKCCMAMLSCTPPLNPTLKVDHDTPRVKDQERPFLLEICMCLSSHAVNLMPLQDRAGRLKGDWQNLWRIIPAWSATLLFAFQPVAQLVSSA